MASPKPSAPEVLAVARRNDGGLSIHTTAGPLTLTGETIEKFALGSSLGCQMTGKNRDKAEDCQARAKDELIRAVTVMLRGRMSLHAACAQLEINYPRLHRQVSRNAGLGALIQAAKGCAS